MIVKYIRLEKLLPDKGVEMGIIFVLLNPDEKKHVDKSPKLSIFVTAYKLDIFILLLQ
jgi:hypothetical protein